jgi:gluconokinase
VSGVSPLRSQTAIIVMGVGGSGKSTVGMRLAARISAPFIEGDEFHSPSNVANMRAGIALEDEDRWPWLDRIALAITAACAENQRVVSACSALKRVYRDRLRERIPARVLFICLEAGNEILSARMSSRPGHFMPPALLSSQLATLERPDASEFALCVDSTLPIDEVLGRVAQRLGDGAGQ